MKLIINADDYGRTKGITDSESECIDHGVINSVSIPPCGHGFDYSILELKKRVQTTTNRIRYSVHIDLVEGPSVLSHNEIPLLIDSKGHYKYSFATLWLYYIKSDLNTKLEIKNQVKKEINAQIDKFINTGLPADVLNVDSHQHMHLVPFIFDLLIEILLERKANHKSFYIRLVNEPFFISFSNGLMISSIMSYLGPNLAKHFILNYLCGKYAVNMRELSASKKLDITYPNYFIGVLFTGYMTLDSVHKALEKIEKKQIERDNTENICIELLFHPCKAVNGEERYWDHLPGLKSYYYSSFRDQEKSLLKSQDACDLINEFS